MPEVECLAPAGRPSAPVASWREVDRIVDLVRLFDDDVSVVVLRRPRPLGLGAWLDALAASERSLQARVAEPSTLEATLDSMVDAFPADEARDALRADLAQLAEIYRELLGVERLGLRLNVFAEDMCPRFHVDRILARLIRTYAGPGTEYLDAADADRARLGAHDGDPEVSAIAGGDRALVRHVPTFSVALLKGDAWPGNSGRGVVHRSHSVAARNEQRILFTIDGLDSE